MARQAAETLQPLAAHLREAANQGRWTALHPPGRRVVPAERQPPAFYKLANWMRQRAAHQSCAGPAIDRPFGGSEGQASRWLRLFRGVFFIVGCAIVLA